MARVIQRYNLAPTEVVPAVVRDRESGQNELREFKWGLVPSWAKDSSGATKMINARGETMFEKPAFKFAARKHRCILPASGFFEWRTERGKKQPYHFRLKGGKPMALAGLWERWHNPSGEPLLTCAIVTTEPNEAVEPFHNRMPVIIRDEDMEAWLDSEREEPRDLLPIIEPYPADEMDCFAVTKKMSRAGYEGPECVEPVSTGDEPSLF